MLYRRAHEWISIDGAIATIGITEREQRSLGEVVYVELPFVGDVLERAQPAGVIESVVAVRGLRAPIDGEVVETNRALANDPTLVNRDALGGGWLYRLALSDTFGARRTLEARQGDESFEDDPAATQ